MKIQGPGYQGDVGRTERGSKSDAASSARPGKPVRKASGDHVEISPAAVELHRLMDAANAAPEVRADRVASLRQAVKNGTYAVDDAELAGRLIEEYLGE